MHTLILSFRTHFMMDPDMTMESKSISRLFVWPIKIIGHLLATIMVTALMIFLMTDHQHFIATMTFSYGLEQFRSETVSSMLMLWGLGSCVWAMGVILYALATSRRESVPYRSLKSARGTIMVETIIILPAYFMLMFGMGQFGLNMISSSMANVAGYSASRAYWVWAPEIGSSRSGTAVTSDMALDKARIAGALVMTGATPGGQLATGNLSDMAKKAQDMTSFPGTGGIIGTLLGVFGGGSGVGATETSYYKSFGDSNFLIRGKGKFKNAYNSIEVTALGGGGGVNFKYKMVQTLPIVGVVFGQMDAGRYRMTIERATAFPAQPYGPNGAAPNSSYTTDNSEGNSGGGSAIGGEFGF